MKKTKKTFAEITKENAFLRKQFVISIICMAVISLLLFVASQAYFLIYYIPNYKSNQDSMNMNKIESKEFVISKKQWSKVEEKFDAAPVELSPRPLDPIKNSKFSLNDLQKLSDSVIMKKVLQKSVQENVTKATPKMLMFLRDVAVEDQVANVEADLVQSTGWSVKDVVAIHLVVDKNKNVIPPTSYKDLFTFLAGEGETKIVVLCHFHPDISNSVEETTFALDYVNEVREVSQQCGVQSLFTNGSIDFDLVLMYRSKMFIPSRTKNSLIGLGIRKIKKKNKV
jgi:hypothetical protein